MRRPLPNGFAPRRRERGAIMVLVVVALAALLLIVGLALDVGHATVNKAYLQNATDAAALAAAKALDESGSTLIATAQGMATFGNNATNSGSRELAAAWGGGGGTINVTIQYSATLPPFTPGAPKGPYVRVVATGFDRPTWFAQIAGILQARVAASAVAGPSPTILQACNVVPIMVCGDPTQAPPGAPTIWGYSTDAPTVLKQSSQTSSPVGPGNFQLIQLGGSGDAIVRTNLAGGYTGCVTLGSSIVTQTGNGVGPTAQGLNTRFGIYSGPMGGTQAQYPPDVITTQPSPGLTVATSGTTNVIMQGSTQITSSNVNTIGATKLLSYQSYVAQEKAGPYNYTPVDQGGTGVFGRRVLSVPIGDCTNTTNGHGTVPMLGLGCFFLLSPVVQKGTDAYVLGQFEGSCDSNGVPGPNPGSGPGPYLIQLYHDPGSGDS